MKNDMTKKILMIGWEYPPYIVGGLGRVCYHLTKELCKKGMEIIFITPHPIAKKESGIRFLSPNLKVIGIKSRLTPYSYSLQQFSIFGDIKNNIYGGNLLEEVRKFTKECEKIIKEEDFDIIHCHDWMTFEAGILAKRIKNKPLVLHVHTTEFDRCCGMWINEEVYNIEKRGFEEADKIIAVSNFMKERIVKFYNVDESKIEVIHNAVLASHEEKNIKEKSIKEIREYIKEEKNKKVVLYLGRVTLHKGPDYFLKAAKIVSDFHKDVIFILAGIGDLLPKMIDLACELGIGDKVVFTGYVKEEKLKDIYGLADVYVMPSVSEPFGITALEAALNGTPVILTKNSGAKEVLRNSMLVDFWDVNEMANKILAVLNYNVLKETLAENAKKDALKITWSMQAEKIIENVYSKLW